MTNTKIYRYSLPNPKEVAGMSGEELLQAIIDGRLPQVEVLGYARSRHMVNTRYYSLIDDQ